MAKLTPEDRAGLAQIAEAEGKLAIVTVRQRVEVAGAIALLKWAESLCEGGYLRLDRISGDRNSPIGERRYDYLLTAKGEKAAKR